MRGLGLRVGMVVAALTLLPSLAHAAAGPNRYTLQGGCYALQDGNGAPIAGGEQVRMEATDLGSYLLYRPDKTYLASQAGGAAAPPDPPASAPPLLRHTRHRGKLSA